MTLTITQGNDSNAINQIVEAINAGGSGGNSYLFSETKSVGTGGDFATLDALQLWLNDNRGAMLTVNVLGSVASPTGGMLITSNFTWTTLNGVSGSEINEMIVIGDCALSGVFDVAGNVAFSEFLPNLAGSMVTLTSTGATIISLQNCKTSGVSITNTGSRLEIERSVIYQVVADDLRLTDCNLFKYTVAADGAAACGLQGNNSIGIVDADSHTVNVLLEAGGGCTRIGSVVNDSGVSTLASGVTVNTFTKYGYVTVGNK